MFKNFSETAEPDNRNCSDYGSKGKFLTFLDRGNFQRNPLPLHSKAVEAGKSVGKIFVSILVQHTSQCFVTHKKRIVDCNPCEM